MTYDSQRACSKTRSRGGAWRLFAPALLCAALISACGNEIAKPRDNVSWDEFKRLATHVVEGRELYIVDGDVRVSEDVLRQIYDESYAEPPTSTASSSEPPRAPPRSTRSIVDTHSTLGDNIWRHGQQLNLTYCVSSTEFQGNYGRAVTEMFQAAMDWEKEAAVHFEYVPGEDANCTNANPRVVFAVRPTTSANLGGCSFYPNPDASLQILPPCTERELLMNFSYFDVTLPALGVRFLKSVGGFRHELGHILGLRHEHIRVPAARCTELDITARALSPYDTNSVMHYPPISGAAFCNGNINTDFSITKYDALAVRTLYGGHFAANTGNPSAYVRPDSVSAVLLRDSANHIRELSLSSAPWTAGGAMHWGVSDLTSLTASISAAGDPAAYVRSDQWSAVVFRGADNHVYELSLPDVNETPSPPIRWGPSDLTKLTGAPAAAGDPAAYVRSDAVNAVVFRDPAGHIQELSLQPGGAAWDKADLTTLTNAPAAAGNPAAYVRSDETNVIVYRGVNGHIYELYLPRYGAAWGVGDLTALTGAPLAAGDPTGYVRRDQCNSVVYRGTNGHVFELGLQISKSVGSGQFNGPMQYFVVTFVTPWTWSDLSALTAAPPAASDVAAYVRTDGVTAVLFRDISGHVQELTLPANSRTAGGWSKADLTAMTGVPAAIGKPIAYLRSDTVNAVMFRSAEGHLRELSLSDGAPAWGASDLSALVGL